MVCMFFITRLQSYLYCQTCQLFQSIYLYFLFTVNSYIVVQVKYFNIDLYLLIHFSDHLELIQKLNFSPSREPEIISDNY